jgi:hypothetical protein
MELSHPKPAAIEMRCKMPPRSASRGAPLNAAPESNDRPNIALADPTHDAAQR